MGYYYVCDNSGTFTGTCTGTEGTSPAAADGKFSSMESGAFGSGNLTANNVYPTVQAALTNADANTDIILVSDAHYETVTTIGNGYNLVIAVSNSNADTFSSTRPELNSGGTNLRPSGSNTWVGIHFNVTINKDIEFNGNWKCFDCYLESLKTFTAGYTDGKSALFVDSEITTADGIQPTNGTVLEFEGCTITTTSTECFTIYNFYNGGGTIRARNCDLSGISGSSYFVLNNGSDATNDDTINIEVTNCKIGAFTGWHNENFSKTCHSLLVAGCGSDTNAEYQYYFHTYGVSVEDESSIFRNESTAWPRTGVKTSLKIDTNTFSVASPTNPVTVTLPMQYIDASATSTVTIYFASTTSLDDGDIMFEAYYPDSTNPSTRSSAVTVANYFNPFRTPSSFTDDSSSSTWKNGQTTPGTGDADLTGYNEYRTTLTLSSGEEGVPVILCHLMASAVVYVDAEFGLS